MHPSARPVLDRRHRGNAEIEFLRGYAILSVLVMHAPVLCIPFPAGALSGLQRWVHPATGVDLFFVVSGYLMGRSFVGPFEAIEAEGRDARVRRAASFWVRRFFRLFPALALWMGLTLLATIVSDDRTIWPPPRDMFLKVVASLASVRNFEEAPAPGFLAYVWSLSVEDQFYLALPLLLMAVPRRFRVPGLIGLCALNAAWRPGGENWWLFRYGGLVWGLLLFELERAGAARPLGEALLPDGAAGRLGWMAALGAVLLAAPVALSHDHPLGWTLVDLAGTGLVFAASREAGVIRAPPLLRTAMLWLGSRSYSLYLCHIPVWFSVLDLMRRAGLGTERWVPLRFALAMPVVLVATDLTYRRIELPLQERGRARARRVLSREASVATP